MVAAHGAQAEAVGTQAQVGVRETQGIRLRAILPEALRRLAIAKEGDKTEATQRMAHRMVEIRLEIRMSSANTQRLVVRETAVVVMKEEEEAGLVRMREGRRAAG